jgi:hypothetical protein
MDGLNCRRKSKYKCANRFEVQHLDIVEDLLNEDQMMETTVRKGWTLSLVFGVISSDKDVEIKY